MRDTYDYLSKIEEPSMEELESIEALLNPDKLLREEVNESPSYMGTINDLLDFSRTESGRKRKINPINPIQNKSIQELGIRKRTVTELNNIGIFTIGDLLKTPREELRTIKFVGNKVIDEIAEILMKNKLTLAGDSIYTCSKCAKTYVDVSDDKSIHHCKLCCAKTERINSISEYSVTISPPEYSSFTTSGDGFLLYANITNNTYELQKIRLCDFYIVSDGQQRSPDSFFTGYMFTEEMIMPITSRSCAKIWSKKSMKKDKLTANDYALITLEASSHKYMFKFVFNGNTWDIDDYFKQ